MFCFPKKIKGYNIDAKTDSYSLGLVFMEMTCPYEF